MRLSFLTTAVISIALAGAQAWGDVSYTIKKGDSLYKISRKFQIGINEIKKANYLKTKKLTPGKELTIPIAENLNTESPEVVIDNPPVENASVTASEVYTVQAPIKAEPRTYKVKKGDSLWSIARKNSIHVAELKKLNNLKSRKLKLGQVLVLEKEPVDIIKAETDIPLVIRTGPDAKYVEELKEISSSAESEYSKTKEFLISVAQDTLGIPYKFGASSFKATDCSGYVKMVFNLIGMDLPRSAREQFKVGQSVDREDLSIGDLVFFKTYAPFPSHVGIYLGNNLFVHASSYAKKVTIDSLNLPYYFKRFIGAKRLEGLKDQESLIPLDNN
ncbi:MAG: LysM peptidoglycan-binding domain-containing protein [Nitrospirae bacterium]|nr:LysM peptidoglycan-binding domain-containing protein [Nitrospirota bacterium]